jgi:lysozyme
MSNLTVSPAGLAFLREREGLRLQSYQDQAGVWTIGYGDTGPHVKPGQTITRDEAERRFGIRVKVFAESVLLSLTSKPTQGQFDAMVSLAYNIGVAAFKDSTVCKAFNRGDLMACAEAFGLFVKVRDKKTGKKRDNAGLIKRRAMEKAMFLADTSTGAAPAVAEAVPIGKTGTVQGGALATGASVLAGLGALVQQFQDVLMGAPWVGPLAQTAVAYYPKIAGALALIAVGAGLYVVYRRVSDRKAGRI